MEIQQIKYFVQVAHELNFTRAAELCRVAQPSLSQQIQKLERELGGPLFHRLGRRIRLTDLGEALLPRAERMLQLHKETLREAGEYSAGGGRVRFGAILTIAPYLIDRVVQLAGRSDAGLQLEAHEDFTENLLQKLRDGVLDFAIMSTPVEEPSMLCRVIATEPFVAVFPDGHPLLDQPAIQLNEVLAEPFLRLSDIHCAGRQISDLCRIGGERGEATMLCTQIETILRLVVQGSGVTILPQMALPKLKEKGLAYRQFEGSRPTREIALVQHQDRYISPSARTLMKIVEEISLEICATVGSVK